MKTALTLRAIASLAMVLMASGLAYSQAYTVRDQANWARPILKNLDGSVVAPGTQLQPNTSYYISLEALPPIASDNQGRPVLNVIYIQDGDGFAPGSLPNGKDVPVPGGRGYQGDIFITTDNAANLTPQLYIRYRGATYEIDPNTGFAEGTPTRQIRQALIP